MVDELHIYRVYNKTLRHHNSLYGSERINNFLNKGFTTPNLPKDIPINISVDEIKKLPNCYLIAFTEKK